MQFTVQEVKENEDGSANVVLDLDNEAREYLINYAFIRMMKDALDEGKLYQVKEESTNVRTNL